MIKEVIETIKCHDAVREIIKVRDDHGSLRFLVREGKYYIGKGLILGGYTNIASARRRANIY